jgi:pyridoxine kinase
MSIKKIACINDFSGFGRCSLTVALPVLSVCGVQCCALPTAVFSNHTGFESFFRLDLTDIFNRYADEWEKLHLHFDAIYSGYLADERQIALVETFIERFTDRDKNGGTVIIVDPVMGDGGKLYKSFGIKTAEGLSNLSARADILTPNLTEACILAKTDYNPAPDTAFLMSLAAKINAPKLVITGIETADTVRNFICENGVHSFYDTAKRVPPRSGTGDVFASIIAAAAVKGMDFTKSVKIAADFVKKAAEKSFDLGINETEGAAFEPFLAELGAEFAKAFE